MANYPGNLVDGSGSIAVGSTAQEVFPANISRQYLLIQNISAGTLWFDIGTTAVLDQPSIRLLTNEAFEFGAHTGVIPTGAVSIIGASGSAKFVAKEG